MTSYNEINSYLPFSCSHHSMKINIIDWLGDVQQQAYKHLSLDLLGSLIKWKSLKLENALCKIEMPIPSVLIGTVPNVFHSWYMCQNYQRVKEKLWIIMSCSFSNDIFSLANL